MSFFWRGEGMFSNVLSFKRSCCSGVRAGSSSTGSFFFFFFSSRKKHDDDFTSLCWIKCPFHTPRRRTNTPRRLRTAPRRLFSRVMASWDHAPLENLDELIPGCDERKSEFTTCACAHTPVHTSRCGRYFVQVAYIYIYKRFIPTFTMRKHTTLYNLSSRCNV